MQVTIENHILKASFYSKGAELFSLIKKSDKREYIWEANPEFWGKSSPILFPIVGRLKNDTYLFKGTSFSLPRHGFARDMDFEIIEKSESEVVFAITSNEKSLKVYPFEFELHLNYKLVENELQFNYTIINHSSQKMPFCIGAHPAFAIPNKITDYSLSFEKEETLDCYTLSNELLTEKYYPIVLNDKKLALQTNTFENDALIFKTLQSKKITLIEKTTPILSVTFDDFKSLGIWSKVGAPFVCIEPWLGYADTTDSTQSIMEKEGILILESNSTFNCSFLITIC